MARYLPHRLDRIHRPPRRWPWILAALICVAGYLGWSLSRPFPALAGQTSLPSLPTVTASPLPWPSYGQAALGVDGYGLVTTRGAQTAHPIASIAKTILALQLLKQKPLKVGDTGPTLTLTQADVDLYKQYLAQNGSVVPVQVGEQLTEYQALQALLLPSGDNIADTLAIWGFGSITNYLTIANQYVASLGLTQTHLADPSGLSPQSVSSARDLVLLGEQILAEPVLAEIVSQATTTLPVAGKVSNVNWLLGHDNFVGIKTGNTDQAGGCFLFAVTTTLAGRQQTVIGAFLGGPSLSVTLHDADIFAQQLASGLQALTIAKAGASLASYQLPWGASVPAVLAHDATIFVVNGAQVKLAVTVAPIHRPQVKGESVGSATVTVDGSDHVFPVTLSASVLAPSIWWKLFHPRGYYLGH